MFMPSPRSRVDKLTGHVEEGITGLDVWQEGVSQPLALVGTFHQTRDVHHIEEGGHLAATGGIVGEWQRGDCADITK